MSEQPLPLQRRFHQIINRPDLGNSRRVGELGSLIYLLDDDGKSITSGHHQLWIEGSVLYGTFGAMQEQIRLTPEVKQNA